jgi:hypothetical protein
MSVFLIKGGWRDREYREVKLVQYGSYVVIPLNEKKKKHRGRKVTFLELDDKYGEAYVLFKDTNRKGFVDSIDLIPEYVEPDTHFIRCWRDTK